MISRAVKEHDLFIFLNKRLCNSKHCCLCSYNDVTTTGFNPSFQRVARSVKLHCLYHFPALGTFRYFQTVTCTSMAVREKKNNPFASGNPKFCNNWIGIGITVEKKNTCPSHDWAVTQENKQKWNVNRKCKKAWLMKSNLQTEVNLEL